MSNAGSLAWIAFQAAWTADVGTVGYDKAKWMKAEAALLAVGVAPLLGTLPAAPAPARLDGPHGPSLPSAEDVNAENLGRAPEGGSRD